MSDPELHPEQPPAYMAMQAASAVSTFVGHRGNRASGATGPLSLAFPSSLSHLLVHTGIRPRSHSYQEAPDPVLRLPLHSVSSEITDKARSQMVNLEGAVHRRQRAEVLVFTSVGHLCKMADEATHQTMMGMGEPEDKS